MSFTDLIFSSDGDYNGHEDNETPVIIDVNHQYRLNSMDKFSQTLTMCQLGLGKDMQNGKANT